MVVKEKVKVKRVSNLFKSWFGDDIEQKIIKSAIVFWFKDADSKAENKVIKYFKEY